MIQLFSRLVKLPLDALVYSMEMFVKTMQGLQHIAYQSIDMMADWDIQVPVEVSIRESAVPEVTQAMPEVMQAMPKGASRGHTETTQGNIQEEARRMPDRDLHDDMLKLVRYKVLFVKRDYEHVFTEVEELVAENTDAASYTAWKIAEFIQQLRTATEKDKITIPDKWKEYPDDKDPQGKLMYREGKTLLGFPEDDKKYLRVYYEILERYPRERFRYEERQIEVLEQIRDKMH